MSPLAPHTDMTRREALDALASAPVDELRRMAQQLDSEQKVIKALFREKTGQPDQRRFGVVGADD